ncbi:MAG: hypothetical protein ABI333_05315 [bacterium]
MAETTRLLGWGDGVNQVGLLPRATEQLAQGPAAVAVGPDGAAFVLDRRNGRVLRLDGNDVSVAAAVPVDAEDLAVSAAPGEALLAAYSPLRARVWLRDAGKPAGEVAVPRVLRLTRGIVLGASRQVLVHNAHQETYRLGSPSTPRLLASVLHSKREGACFLADGSGVAVRRRSDQRAELLVLGQGERAPVKRSFVLPDTVMAARIVGTADGVVCLRLEKAGPAAGGQVDVLREAVCLNADSGAEVFRRALPAPGVFLPRRELALGGSPARLAFIHAEAGGLRVHLWTLRVGKGVAR